MPAVRDLEGVSLGPQTDRGHRLQLFQRRTFLHLRCGAAHPPATSSFTKKRRSELADGSAARSVSLRGDT